MKQKKQNAGKGLQLYIPLSGDKNKELLFRNYGGLSPTNIEFSVGKFTTRCHNYSFHRYSQNRNNYRPRSKQQKIDKIKTYANDHKLSATIKSSNDHDQFRESQRFSLSRMLEKSSKKEGYEWNKIYRFYKKKVRDETQYNKQPKIYDKIVNRQKQKQRKKQKQLTKVLNVIEYRPVVTSSNTHYTKTADDRCRCHKKSNPQTACSHRIKIKQRDRYNRHHRFLSITQTMHLKQRNQQNKLSLDTNNDIMNVNGLKAKSGVIKRGSSQSKRNIVSIPQSWEVDSWNTSKIMDVPDSIF